MSLISRIGIVGAGQMGTGIALTAARASLSVKLVDGSSAQIAKSAAFVKQWASKEAKKQAAMAEVATRITHHSDIAALKDCDAVVECITEKLEAKLALVKSLGGVMKPDALMATNTSSLSVTQLAAAFSDPTRFVGMHFFYPVPVMKLVEVIPGLQTAPETLNKIKSLAATLGKHAVEVKDSPLFIVNRILMVLFNEAVHALAEGVGTVEDIDKTMRLGMNHPMGPLQLADFAGLDTCLEVLRSLHRGFGDCKYRPHPLLTRYVEAGWLGRKSGRGFYRYDTPT